MMIMMDIFSYGGFHFVYTCVAYIYIFTCVYVDMCTSSTPSSSTKIEDVAQKTNNPDAKVMADTLSTAVGLG